MNALTAYNKLNTNVAGLKKSSEKLASGYRINRAGDDAAGLAISEKMRSQIRGLTQAKRNSQDGISMIQTFEGALQESHSILQRMKELASESANGTYQNEVDRDAIQLEFDQLNDELNQIADTDFNGVVMLNGGEMADGMKAVNGKFDYTKKGEQVAAEQAEALAAAQAKAQKGIDAAQRVFDNAKAAYDMIDVRDLSNNGDSAQWNTVDDNLYTRTESEALFGVLTAGGTDTLADLGVTDIEVRFEADDAGVWSIKDAWYVDETGAKVTVDVSGELEVTTANSTENGGFKVTGKTAATATAIQGKELANAIFNASEVNEGDTVTLTFTNTPSGSIKPTNIGMDEESLKDNTGLTEKPVLELSDVAKNGIDGEMTKELEDALAKLNDSKVTFEYNGKKILANIDNSDLKIEDNGAGKYEISYQNEKGEDIVIASVTPAAGKDPVPAGNATGVAIANTVTAAGTVTGGNQSFYYVDTDADGVGDAWNTAADGTGTELTATTVGGAALTAPTKVGGTFQIGDKIDVTTTAGAQTVGVTYTGAAAKPATSGKVEFGIALDYSKYDPSAGKPTVDASSDPDIDSAKTNAVDKAYYDAKDALAKAKDAYPESYEDLGVKDGVSKADSNNAATAPLTYTDHLVLQTGSRTKDSVDFTFNYNTDGMGELKANLNVSARADGLGTADLSLNTQEAANAAIDKIDNAINKVSMVRATFGATQNRLEHKIENLTTPAENLTEAESTIRDTDMASEMMNYTKFNILQQAAQSMLAQANQQPQSILQLLG